MAKTNIYLGKRFLGIKLRIERLSGSYWFRPLVLIVVALIVSRLMLELDQFLIERGINYFDMDLIFKVTPVEATRASFTGMGSVLLGLFGVLLSLALIPLTIATSTYGSVILRTLLKDKGTQNVVGFFAFTIFFDLSVAIQLPYDITWANYPGLTATMSIILLALSLVATIYFFSHLASLLQATHVTKLLSDELMEEIDSLQGYEIVEFTSEQNKDFERRRAEVAENGTMIRSKHKGYVTGLNYQYLLAKAIKADAVVLILKLPGDYVVEDEPLVKFEAKGKMREKVFIRKINKAYFLAINRTVVQDIDYGVQLLAIIASRALSPAVNDPITATICIDKIGQTLSKIVSEPIRPPYVTDIKGELRIIADPDDFKSLMATGFNQIRQYGCKQYEVMSHQLFAIETIAYSAQRQVDRDVLKEHADLILVDSMSNLTSEWSKAQVKAAYDSAIKVISSAK